MSRVLLSLSIRPVDPLGESAVDQRKAAASLEPLTLLERETLGSRAGLQLPEA
jgi:hypothetical protein